MLNIAPLYLLATFFPYYYLYLADVSTLFYSACVLEGRGWPIWTILTSFLDVLTSSWIWAIGSIQRKSKGEKRVELGCLFPHSLFVRSQELYPITEGPISWQGPLPKQLILSQGSSNHYLPVFFKAKEGIRKPRTLHCPPWLPSILLIPL